jgi:hypothetical protein
MRNSLDVLWHAPKLIPKVCECHHQLQPALAALHQQPVETNQHLLAELTCSSMADM